MFKCYAAKVNKYLITPITIMINGGGRWRRFRSPAVALGEGARWDLRGCFLDFKWVVLGV